MSIFGKKKMENEQDNNAEFNDLDESVPVFDKRRFNAAGERNNTGGDNESPQPPDTRSTREIELDTRLNNEIRRREAAETKLVGVQAKFEEVKSQMERETQEMRERMRKALEDRAKQGQSNFLTSLLPVLDNLNLAIAASESDASFEHLRDGVKGTARSFEQALAAVGVEPISTVDAAFDPEIHEAVEMVPVDPGMDGRITAEYSRGYKFGDRLLRPARVQVGRAAAQSAGE
jgi:molecular chaperone GrpE